MWSGIADDTSLHRSRLLRHPSRLQDLALLIQLPIRIEPSLYRHLRHPSCNSVIAILPARSNVIHELLQRQGVAVLFLLVVVRVRVIAMKIGSHHWRHDLNDADVLGRVVVLQLGTKIEGE